MTTVTVIGAGYVGLTTAACLAYLGHRVRCGDKDATHIQRLRSGQIEVLEPDLPDMLSRYQHSGRITFNSSVYNGVSESETVILCLPTPANPDGSADLSAIEDTLRHLRRNLAPGSQLVVKSTVPSGTQSQIVGNLDRNDVAVISNPEFLREGSAIHDWLHPYRIVIGADTPEIAHHAAALYDGIDAPVVATDPASAELIKYAANTYLAMKISYANTLAELCEHVGGDITDVRAGLSHDPRIGNHYLHPGAGQKGIARPPRPRPCWL